MATERLDAVTDVNNETPPVDVAALVERLRIKASIMARCATTGSPFYGPFARLVRREPDHAVFTCPSCRDEHEIHRDGTRVGYSLILGSL